LYSNAWAYAVDTDAAGDGIAAGMMEDEGGAWADFAVVKLQGTGATELWRRLVNGPGALYEAAFAARVTRSDPATEAFTVVRLRAAHSGRVLTYRDRGTPEGRSLAVVSVDQDVFDTGPEGAAEPTT
jgi:hypothetical protein